MAAESLVIHGLINNAAILIDNPSASDICQNKLKETLNVNLLGTLLLTEKILPMMRDGSHIINITSNWGSFSDQNFNEMNPCYKLSKVALNMYTKMLSFRLKERRILVSAVDPGWVKTGMGGINADKDPDQVAFEILEILKNTSHRSGCFWRNGKERKW